MKQLVVDLISVDKVITSIADSDSVFQQVSPQYIDTLLWSDTGYKPSVSFQIVYTDSSILLKYKVAEAGFKADYHQPNEPVYEDSCVEFFIAFNNEKNYYNLEFNAIGTVLIGFGDSRVDRLEIAPSVISQIKTYHSITTDSDTGLTNWKLLLDIPFSVFTQHQLNTLNGVACKGNFYKCGDGLPQPHFLSWNPIDHPTPNFHLSRFFGDILFG